MSLLPIAVQTVSPLVSPLLGKLFGQRLAGGGITLLQSPWPGVSKHLLGCFFPVTRTKAEDGSTKWVRDKSVGVEVRAPLENAQLEFSLNWQSPFENAGSESKAPTAAAMVQSGAVQPVLDAVSGIGKGIGGAIGQAVGERLASASDKLKQFEGRTGITVLNSTQVFSGMPPVKLSCTANFRAWSDAKSEVTAPVDQLVSWALPVELAADSTMLVELLKASQGEKGMIEAVMPSKAPVFIAVVYKGRSYYPMVIESCSLSLDDPISVDGNCITQSVTLQICSLTALDRRAWAATRTANL